MRQFFLSIDFGYQKTIDFKSKFCLKLTRNLLFFRFVFISVQIIFKANGLQIIMPNKKIITKG